MNDLTIGVLGAGVGVFAAAIGNVIILPFVLRHQERTLADNYRMPIFGWGKGQIAGITRNFYRFFMPVFFGLLGAAVAIINFGAKQ